MERRTSCYCNSVISSIVSVLCQRNSQKSTKKDLSDIVQFAVCLPEDIVNAIRENQFIASSVHEESQKADEYHKVNIHMSRADDLIKNDRIMFSPKLGTFTTKGTDDQPRVVTLFPEKCSCSLKSCYHILAVKKSLSMEIKQKAIPNMSILSAADKKRKAGRKRPRPGDFDYILEKAETNKTNEQTGTRTDVMGDSFTDVREDPVALSMSEKINDEFITRWRKPMMTDSITEDAHVDVRNRKTVTTDAIPDLISRKRVTTDNIMEMKRRKPVTKDDIGDVAGPDWFSVGNAC